MTAPTVEQWRPVVGYEHQYEVSDQGRVRSTRSGRDLNPWVNWSGYPCVELYREGVRSTRRVHSLMAEAFIGPRPEGDVVRHLDGNPANNVLTNLTYGTHSENNHDTVRHGTHQHAIKGHCPLGHAYDGANTYVYTTASGTTNRKCRECHREQSVAYRRRQGEGVR